MKKNNIDVTKMRLFRYAHNDNTEASLRGAQATWQSHNILMLLTTLLVVALLLNFCLVTFCIADDFREPWTTPTGSKIIELKTNTEPKKKSDVKYETNPAKIPFLWGLRFYQKFISPIDGEKCGMYPTCSDYSVRAFKKHGVLIGLMMTTDRLMHEGDEMERAPLIKKYGILRYYDPIKNNDFWFAKENDPS